MAVPRPLLGVVLALAALHPAAVAATELRFSTWVPAQHPLQATGWEPWGRSIEAASGGRITVKIYPAGQLGAAADHYDMARDGIADLAYVDPGEQAGRFPVMALAEIPFLVSDARSGSRALDAWYRAYAAQEMPDVHFCMAYLHAPGTLHAKEKIAVPTDVQGKHVRPAQATLGRFVSLLGGVNVALPAAEARDALVNGVADAITFAWSSVYLFGIDGVAKHHLDLPLYVTAFVTVMNERSYASLPPADRQVIDDHCTSEWAQRVASGWADQEDQSRARLKNALDHELYAPTAGEVAAWRAAAAPLLDAWRKDVTKKGYDAEAVYRSFIGKLEELGALYH